MNLKKGTMLSETKFRTPEFRVSFPHLFETHAIDPEKDKPAYSLQLIFDKGAKLNIFEKAVKVLVENDFKGKRPKKVKEFRDGNDIEDKNGDPRPELVGKNVIRLQSKTRKPRVLDAQREDIVNPEEIYGGCYGVAVVEAYSYDNAFGKGISFGLLGLQKTRDGEPFVGGVSTDDFEDIETDDDDDEEEEGPY